ARMGRISRMDVGIYVFDDVEVLDVAGPFEVFATASRVHTRGKVPAEELFTLHVIGERVRPVRARAGLTLTCTQSFESHPPLDVLVVPGGEVTRELEQSDVIRWIAATARTTRVTASVCTGAFLLAKAGLLDGLRATTHWEDVRAFQEMFPGVQLMEGPRWVDEGPLVTSAGISAGIDMSLHLVARLGGEDLAASTARQMDYAWQDSGV